MDRGKIRNREQAQQIRDFSGLRWGSITPTDIDGFFEMHNEIFILIEIKYGGADLPMGQRLALERLTNLIANKKQAILIIAKHEIPPPEDIPAAECEVTRYYFRGNWHHLKISQNLKEFCDWFIDYAKSERMEDYA